MMQKATQSIEELYFGATFRSDEETGGENSNPPPPPPPPSGGGDNDPEDEKDKPGNEGMPD